MSEPAAEATFITADEVWLDGWRGPSLLRIDGPSLQWVGSSSGTKETVSAHVGGTIATGFTDSHVHLGLIDAAALVDGGIARVIDLGGDPEQVAALRELGLTDLDAVEVDFAGAFLTAPAGYPSDREWAPASSVRQVATPAESAAAIDELIGFGVSRIKIALNSEAGPVWGDAMLATVVAQAHAAGLRVIAHTQGAGEAMRAAGSGVDSLAHTPWTELFDDDSIAALAASVAITSTLDIHGYGDYSADFATASDNLARFLGAGGRVLYGTDLGNGPLPVGINERELAALGSAGLPLEGLLGALGATRASDSFLGRISCIPDAVPHDPADFAAWLSAATVIAIPVLKETFA